MDADSSEPDNAIVRAFARVPFPVWLGLIAVLAAWQCVLWQYGADDVAVFRDYTRWQAGALQVDYGRIAADFTGAWGGNASNEYWRPLVSLSLGLDFALFGAKAGVSCALNLVLHFVSAVLLWRVGLAILPGRRAAALASLLFVATPLAHENLAWLVGRCMWTNVFGLAAALAFLRACESGKRGAARFGPALAFSACNLATMESAFTALAFPPLCVLIRNGFRPHFSGLLRDFVRDAIPFALLGAAYLGLRLALFGGITGAHGSGLEGGPLKILHALGTAFVHTLCPLDSSFLAPGRGQAAFRALTFAPLVVGLAAPLHFRDSRSRGYRRALLALLLFWVFIRLPGLTVLTMDDELGRSRTAYYAYAPLALASGLLASTVRYARWATFLLVLLFGLGLSHRLGERSKWAAAGLRARNDVERVARDRGAIGEDASTRPIAFINMCDGRESAPAVHVGELPLMLSPPFTAKRVRAVSLYGFAPREEPWVAAWFGHELGGVLTIAEPDDPQKSWKVENIDPKPLVDLSIPQLASPKLVPRPNQIPSLEVPAWVQDTNTVLALTAGRAQLVVPLRGNAWPIEAQRALQKWRRQGGEGAPFAIFLERRDRVEDPKSVTGRSRVVCSSL